MGEIPKNFFILDDSSANFQLLPDPYAGADSHTGHIHAGFTRAASQQASMPASLVTRIATLRSGLEDLAHANRNMA